MRNFENDHRSSCFIYSCPKRRGQTCLFDLEVSIQYLSNRPKGESWMIIEQKWNNDGPGAPTTV